MPAFGTALEADSLKTRLLYTAASGLTGRLEEFVQQNLNSSGGLDRPEVEALLAVLDAAIGIVHALKESEVDEEGGIDSVDVLSRVHEHVYSYQLEANGGAAAQDIVEATYEELESQAESEYGGGEMGSGLVRECRSV